MKIIHLRLLHRNLSPFPGKKLKIGSILVFKHEAIQLLLKAKTHLQFRAISDNHSAYRSTRTEVGDVL